MYIVKKFEQSPFNNDYLGKNVLILCNKETGEPYAEVASSWVIEGEEYLKEDVKCNCTCN